MGVGSCTLFAAFMYEVIGIFQERVYELSVLVLHTHTHTHANVGS